MSKDNEALVQLLELLEARYAMRVIRALADGHPQTFRLLQDSVGGVTPNTLNTRLKELRAVHLVDHCGTGYRLTPQGIELARRLDDLRVFAGRWNHHRHRGNGAAPRPTAPRTAAGRTASRALA